ncbi:ATP-binding protein [Paenibacillus sp. FSL M8-0334]|uniref:Biotin carboxylase n=1 Tax=Paenibacillus campinasensis TaxID=66347 RepID=A0ABW9T1S8_9BACL|nr:ATP-binding protein [Paenibacillus campinasensis]MUG67253.1 biotin carboxylase [Paenibacillus campinasensis]
MNELKIPKRLTTAIVNSLTAGVVPRVGLEYIAVGRKPEVESILRDMDNIAEGGAAFRLITGRYGSGKSFLLQMIRNYATDRDFVVADADLSPERRLVGTKGQGLATYRELMTHLSTKTRPDGGALEAILQKWIASVQQGIMQEKGLRPGDAELDQEVELKIYAVANSMRNLVHGFDFAKVLAAYWSGYKLADDDRKGAALRWLRGEYPTRTEARKDLGVGVIIDDDNWYDYMKLWAEFTAAIGYRGLLLFIDEGVNLYKITNSISRHSNYEKLLTMFNDTMQGKAEHLGIYLGGTPQFVEDERRGLFSYDALRSRLIDGRYGSSALRTYTSPILKLDMLSHEEILVLLQKLRDIHALHFQYEVSLTDEQLIAFMQMAVGRLGAEELLTTREVVRDFMDVLHTLHQHHDVTFEELLGERAAMRPDDKERKEQPADELDDLLAEFEL